MSTLNSLDDFHGNIAAFNYRHGSPRSDVNLMQCMVLRAQLITEELSELLEAAFRIDQKGSNDMEKTYTDLMDAYGDLLYVVIGTGSALDLDSTEILRLVCASNDSKRVTGDPRVRDKGPDFFPPDFSELVQRHLHG
jgi:predicted HAD superfamily Cof-like phosphohydrolase